MKRLVLLALAILAFASIAYAQTKAQATQTKADPARAAKAGINNPAIDMKGYLLVAEEAARHRESRRLTEDEFIQMGREFGTIIYDARSQQKYNELHIKDAINLSFPDITVESLKATFPDKNARILIYCNNNFVGEQRAFPTKIMTASLNLSTYIALYSYGYRNIYELGPLLDVKTSKLDFEGTLKQ
jgi:Rhodanese-like domain